MDKKHQHDNNHEHTHNHGDTEHTHAHDHSTEHGHSEESHGHKHEGCCGQHGKDDKACCKSSEKQGHSHEDHNHDHDGHHHHDHEGHDHDDEPITLDLVLDDGKEVKCEVVGIFEVEGKEYIALLPFDDDRVLLYTYEEVDEELNLENIEDDEVFKKVSETFWEIFGDDDFEKIEEE